MDETGFQIGVGKNKLVVTKRRKRSSYLGVPTNRESATAIEAISVGGLHIPGFLILSGRVHQSLWYKMPQLHNHTVIGLSDSGYSNDQLSLYWLKHFGRHTKGKIKGRKRLLILDDYGSHHTYEFVNYAENNHIVLFGLPPHLTHLLQPLDVVVFQPLKHWHSQAIDLLIRDGIEQITKLEFLQIIQDIRKKAFKETTIKSAFRKTGIWPFNPSIVIDYVRQLHPCEATPSESAWSESENSQLFSSLFKEPECYGLALRRAAGRRRNSYSICRSGPGQGGRVPVAGERLAGLVGGSCPDREGQDPSPGFLQYACGAGPP